MEASYCYIVNENKEAETINETTNLETTQDETQNSASQSSLCSSSDKTHESKNEPSEESLNGTTSIYDIKKNLCNEEEFRSINHLEPIHIFLKLKPLSEQEMAKQNNAVNSNFQFFKFYLIFFKEIL